jgi:glucan phosphoethanolaminetransferase (alkaline phosphatase superfamily)
MLISTFSFLLRAAFVAFWLFVSLLCVFAYLPYLYYAFILAPPFPAIPLFMEYHSTAYWCVWSALFCSYVMKGGLRERSVQVGLALFAVVGLFIQSYSPYRQLAPGAVTLELGFLSLLPIALLFLFHPDPDSFGKSSAPVGVWTVSNVSVAAFVFASVHFAGSILVSISTGRSLADRALWISNLFFLVKAAAFALLLTGIIQTVVCSTRKRAHAQSWRRASFLLLMTLLGGFIFHAWLRQTLGFYGVDALRYAGAFCFAMALAFRVLAPTEIRLNPALPWSLLAILTAVIGIVAPVYLEAIDWNGVGATLLAFSIAVVCAATLVRFAPERPYDNHIAAPPILCLLAMATLLFIPRMEAHTGNQKVRATFSCAWPSVRGEDFCKYLERHTNIAEDLGEQIPLELSSNLQRTPDSKPNIIILVVDSLRPDYLSTYAADVDFTPNIQKFADESFVFRNAFTPYAGTVMAEPSIWAGAELLHKLYLQPFRNVNGLEKLLDAEGYTKVVSVDTVLSALLPNSPNLVSIDRNLEHWGDFDFCATWPKAVAAMQSDNTRKPKFFFAQSVNVQRLALSKVAAALRVHRRYVGRNAKYASELQRYDACFGAFVSAMKAKGWWDNSIVVLTSDHGDAMGEGGRNGHSYVVSPEVMRIPLIIRVPAGMRKAVKADVDNLAFLHDIAPSLYWLLNHPLNGNQPLRGHSLFRKTADPQPAPLGDVVISSDNQPIYGVIADNGKTLYVVDIAKNTSALYDTTMRPFDQGRPAPPDLESRYQALIYDHVRLVAKTYGYNK